jgi:NADH-quinone oxidoreductase subunit E
MLRGANEIVDHLKEKIGVKDPDEVSKDGMFSYEEVECLGACELAPMLRVDHKYHYLLTDEKIDDLVEERRSPGTATGGRPLRPASPATSPPSGEDTSPQVGRKPRKKADG